MSASNVCRSGLFVLCTAIAVLSAAVCCSARDLQQSASGSAACNFPFTYDGVEHNECILLGGESVCKTILGHWNACDDALSSASSSTGQQSGDAQPIRICTQSAREQEFCGEVVDIMNDAAAGRFTFSCFIAGVAPNCVEAIADDMADMITVGAGEILYSWDRLGLRGIAHERYPDGSTTYDAVAVVRKEFCEVDGFVGLHSLRGQRSCHTGYRKMAGWRMPFGTFVALDHIPIVSEDARIENDAETLATFFSSICAPRTSGNGPVNTEDGKGALWDPLCTGCTSPDVVDESDRCTMSDPYFNYDGAFRCLSDGAGDVAFVKHTTVPDFATDGNNPASWATGAMDDYRLLCPSGGCADITNSRDCNLAKVPAHVVMASPLKPFVQDGSLARALADISRDTRFQDKVFNSGNNPHDLLFSANAERLLPMSGDTASYLGSTTLALKFLELLETA